MLEKKFASRKSKKWIFHLICNTHGDNIYLIQLFVEYIYSSKYNSYYTAKIVLASRILHMTSRINLDYNMRIL